MNTRIAFCPNCKNEAPFEQIDAVQEQCSVCGGRFELAPARLDSGAARGSEAGEFLSAVGRFVLILVAIVVVGIALLFAGCIVLARRL